MKNKIKIICADMLHLKQKRENCKKKSNTKIDSIISMTSRATLPDLTEIDELEISLMEESAEIKEMLEKINILRELTVSAGMNQMVMNFEEK